MSVRGDAQIDQSGQSATIDQKHSETSKGGEITTTDHEINKPAAETNNNARVKFDEPSENRRFAAADIASDNDSLFNDPSGTEMTMSPVIHPATFSQIQGEGVKPPKTIVWPKSSLTSPIYRNQNPWMLSPGATELPHDNFGWQIYNSTCPLAPKADSDPSYWEVDPQFDSYLLRKEAGENPDAEYLDYEPIRQAKLARVATLQPFLIEDIPSDEHFTGLGNRFTGATTEQLFDGIRGYAKVDPLLGMVATTEQSEEDVPTANQSERLQVEEINTASSCIRKDLQPAANQRISACDCATLATPNQASNIRVPQILKRTTHIEESFNTNAASSLSTVSMLSSSHDSPSSQTPNAATKVIAPAQQLAYQKNSPSPRNKQLSISKQAKLTRKATQPTESYDLNNFSVQSVARVQGRKENFFLQMDVDEGIRFPNGFLPPGMYATKPQKQLTVKEGPIFSDIELSKENKRRDISIGRTVHQDQKPTPKCKRPVLLPSALSPSDTLRSLQTRRVSSQIRKPSESMKRVRQESNTVDHERMKRFRTAYTPTPQPRRRLISEESMEKASAHSRDVGKQSVATASSEFLPKLLEAWEYYMAQLQRNIPSSGAQEAGWTKKEILKMKLSNEFLQHTAQMGHLTEMCASLNLQFLLAQDSSDRDGRACLKEYKAKARDMIDSELYGAVTSKINFQFQREVVDSKAFQHVASYHLATLAKLACLQASIPTNDNGLERARRFAGYQTRAMDKQLRELRKYAAWVQRRALRAMEEPNAKKFMKISEEHCYLMIGSLRYISNRQYESITGDALSLDAEPYDHQIHVSTLGQYTPPGKNSLSSTLLGAELAASPVLRNMSRFSMPPRARCYSQSVRGTGAVGQSPLYHGGNHSRSQNEYGKFPVCHGLQQEEPQRLGRPQLVGRQDSQNQVDRLACQLDQNSVQTNPQMMSQMSNQPIIRMGNEHNYATGQHRGMQMRHHASYMNNQIMRMKPQNIATDDDPFQMQPQNSQMRHAQMGHNRLQMQPQMPYVSTQMPQHQQHFEMSHSAELELNQRKMNQLCDQMNIEQPQMTFGERFRMLNSPKYNEPGQQSHENGMQHQRQTPMSNHPVRGDSLSPQQFDTPNSGSHGQNGYGNASSPEQFHTPQGGYRFHP